MCKNYQFGYEIDWNLDPSDGTFGLISQLWNVFTCQQQSCRVVHIYMKCVKKYSKLFIPFLEMMIDKKNWLNQRWFRVLQVAFPFRKGLSGEFFQNLNFLFQPSRNFFWICFRKNQSWHPDTSLCTHINMILSIICHCWQMTWLEDCL